MEKQAHAGVGVPDARMGDFVGNRVLASYDFDPRKRWPFLAGLLVLIALGLGRIYDAGGLEGQWLAVFLLVGMPGLAFVMFAAELRLGGPVLLITEKGLLDRRHGPELIPWDRIELAEVRKKPFISRIRIILTGQERYDIELMLLQADPAEVMTLINRQATRIVAKT